MNFIPRIVKDPEERKEELLQIGIHFFLQDGVRGVSIRSVVREAKVATGLFYYYFDTKEDFIEQVLERYVYSYVIGLEEIVNRKNVSIADRLDLLLRQFYVRFDEVSKVQYDELLDYPQHFTLVENLIVKRLHGAIMDFVEEGRKCGYFHIPESNITTLFMIHGLVGVIPKSRFLNDDNAHDAIRRLVLSTLSIRDEA